jgi:hypothetical protein
MCDCQSTGGMPRRQAIAGALVVGSSVAAAAGATTSFISRGSQRWPAGTAVSTPTIAGHRDLSYTACPGDAFYPLLPEIRTRAIAQHDAWITTLKPARRLGVVTL